VPRLTRRGDDLGVVTVGEHGAPPAGTRLALADRRVEVLGCRDLESLHPRCEGPLVVGFYEQVDVGTLDAEVHDPEAFAPSGGERGFTDRPVDTPAAQVADRADDPQHDMNGIPCVKVRSLLVRRTGPLTLRRAASAAPLATALLEQRKLLGLGAPVSRAGRRTLADHRATWITTDVNSVKLNSPIFFLQTEQTETM
jgi:hypothetical protein